LGTSSIRYVDSSYIYGQTAVNTVTNPVRNTGVNPVIYAPFPRYINKKSAAEKINKVLSLVLFALVLTSFISYYFVSDGEKIMNNLGREIAALSNENMELQNKLDNLNSFNKVDTIIAENHNLDTARKVIEIPNITIASAPKIQPVPVNYIWSVGY